MNKPNRNPRKKVLFLISRFLDGGIDTVLAEYLRNIDPMGYDVTLAIGLPMECLEVHRNRLPDSLRVVYLADKPILYASKMKKVKGELGIMEKIVDETVVSCFRKMRMRSRLRQLIDESDIVVDFDCSFYTDLSRTPRHGEERIALYHFSPAKNMEISPRHTRRQLRGWRGYDRVVLLCEAMKAEAERLTPQMREKFQCIYNGYDLETFRKRAREGELRIDNPYFLSVARLEESQKDNTTLLRAYARFRKRLTAEEILVAPRLILIGDGKSREQLELLSRELEIDKFVEFKGFLADPAPWIAASLAFVLSSRYEGLPMALIEAQILGKATVASDCPTGPREILLGGETGMLVSPSDADALATALLAIFRDSHHRNELESNALKQSSRFDIHNSVKQLLREKK